jgi:multicomponent Na+:H+ antiporter subunit B
MLLFSLWVLFRGHNLPGGGFIAGLLAASSLSLYLIAYGLPRLLAVIRLSPLIWLCIGLMMMLISGLWGLISTHIFLQSVWLNHWGGLINSALLFDIGVYIVVCFAILSMLIALERTQ